MLADGFADDPLTTSGAIGADADVSRKDGAASTRGAAVALRASGRLAARTPSSTRLAPTEVIALAAPMAEGAPSPTSPWPCIEGGARDEGPLGAPAPWLEAAVDANADASLQDGAITLAMPTAVAAPSPTRPRACIESGAEDDGPMGAPRPWLKAAAGADADLSLQDGAGALATPLAEGAPSPTSPGTCIESGARDDGPTGGLPPSLKAAVGANAVGPTPERLK
jgi:hypothetical protein